MKKRQITFWKNSGHEALRGKTVEIFKVSWHEMNAEWIRDDEGPYWGIYKLDTEEVRRLSRDPNSMGNVTYIESEDVDREQVVISGEDVGTIEEIMGVDHLEAEDISITPEGLDLGEDE